MTGLEATAEVFWTALKALPRKEQQAVLRRILQDGELRRDTLDRVLSVSTQVTPSGLPWRMIYLPIIAK